MTSYRNWQAIKPRVLRKINQTISAFDRISPCLFFLREVILVDSMAVEVDGRTGFACVLKLSKDHVKMAIGAKYVRHPDINYRDWLNDMLPHIIAHEWVHLEQIRDNRNLTERGVEVRARNLITNLQAESIKKRV